MSSINDTHTDITYGYLEYVDVAFVVLNINTGSASQSLIDFLKDLSENAQSKIYFVLNFIDTKSADQIAKLQEEFRNSLPGTINVSRILLVSALMAVEANENKDQELYEQSGITQLSKIISEEIPQLHEEIQDRRRYEFLGYLKTELISALSSLIKFLDFNDQEYFETLKTIKNKIAELKATQSELLNELEEMEMVTRQELEKIVDTYSPSIFQKLNSGDDFTDEANLLAIEVESTLRNNLEKIEEMEINGLADKLTASINTSLDLEFSSLFGVTNKLPKIINSAAIAWATGGTSLAANAVEFTGAAIVGEMMEKEKAEREKEDKQKVEIAKEKLPKQNNEGSGAPVKEVSNNSEPEKNSKSTESKTISRKRKGWNSVITVLEQLNVVGHLKDYTMKKTMSNKIRRSLQKNIELQCSFTFKEVNRLVNAEIEQKISIPLSSEMEALEITRKNREIETQKIEKQKEEIERNILDLKIL